MTFLGKPTIREERELHIKDLEHAKSLVAGVTARCTRMIARDPLDAHNFAQRDFAERICIQIALLQEKVGESVAETRASAEKIKS